MKRSYSRISVYVGKEFLFSTFVAFLFFFFIFFINQILLLAEEILAKKVPLQDVFLIIIYSLPAIIALSFPFASLVGCLMAVGKLASANEMIAIQASGIPLRRVFLPLIVLGVVFSSASFVVNDYFLPLGTLNFGRLYRKLLYSHPELEMESYTVKNFQDSIIATGKVDSRTVDGILIIDKEPDGGKRIITAGRARIDRTMEGVISLVLDDVTVHSVGKKEKQRYSYTFTERMSYNILLKNISSAFRNPGPREMSSYDVYREIRKKRGDLRLRSDENRIRAFIQEMEYRLTYDSVINRLYEGRITYDNGRNSLDRVLEQVYAARKRRVSDRSLQIYLIEFYKKFSIPFSCLTFIVFAFPVGLFTRRSGKTVGFGIGLFISIFYWGMLVAGQTLGIRAEFSPFLSMWLPNLVILILGGAAFIVRAAL